MKTLLVYPEFPTLLELPPIFLGEAETNLPEFVRDLERGEPKRIYQAAERPALSATPIPHFQLADLKQYSAMSVQYSRGCPIQCEFCDIIEIYGRGGLSLSHADRRLISRLSNIAQQFIPG